MMRAGTEVRVTTPKVARALRLFPGGLNWAWLKALKKSVRNCRLPHSRILLFFCREISQLFWPGPMMSPTLVFPKPEPALGFVEPAAPQGSVGSPAGFDWPPIHTGEEAGRVAN